MISNYVGAKLLHRDSKGCEKYLSHNSLLRRGCPLGIPIKINFLRHEGDLYSSLRLLQAQKWEMRGEEEKRDIPLPFSLSPLSPTLFAACYAGYLYRGRKECNKLNCEQALHFGDIVKSTRTGGFAARSRVLARSASVAQIRELAHRLVSSCQ